MNYSHFDELLNHYFTKVEKFGEQVRWIYINDDVLKIFLKDETLKFMIENKNAALCLGHIWGAQIWLWGGEEIKLESRNCWKSIPRKEWEQFFQYNEIKKKFLLEI